MSADEESELFVRKNLRRLQMEESVEVSGKTRGVNGGDVDGTVVAAVAVFGDSVVPGKSETKITRSVFGLFFFLSSWDFLHMNL